MKAFLVKIINRKIICLNVLVLLKIHVLWSLNAIIYLGLVHNYEIQAMFVFSHRIN